MDNTVNYRLGAQLIGVAQMRVFFNQPGGIEPRHPSANTKPALGRFFLRRVLAHFLLFLHPLFNELSHYYE
ncbi:hypothetical protein HCU74_11075 [Spongiibacter sp. KMU-166]|uniref:Uncharacterized protein n=1 Tax=Spongiibacter thalassae TaxID=2721624 RepID=A0ABX1GHE0_9GAMM|nr:hypothetical protein [Spongiibacter thalassae]NKI17948.1 hypothetical protein [Spongiibacter thalassae]